jgi:hypothetical protein
MASVERSCDAARYACTGRDRMIRMGPAPSHVIRKWSSKFIDFSRNAAKLRQHKISIEPNVFALVDTGDARL